MERKRSADASIETPKTEAVLGPQITTRKKSRRQQKRERRERVARALCREFVQGNCVKGAACRFSHDVDAFLAQKPAPLPGVCVFPSCPFGVTCRFDHDDRSEEEPAGEILPKLETVAALRNGLPPDVRVALRKGTFRTEATELPMRREEGRRLDFAGKLYLAPLTTLGNLPFRRTCLGYGADVTCSEMALATNLLKGQQAEWALLKRHPSERLFGIQVCGGSSDVMGKCGALLSKVCEMDFVDVNLGCPIDAVCQRSAGASLLLRPRRIESLCRALTSNLSCPVTLKMRKGYHDQADVVHRFLPEVGSWGVEAVTLHGRTRAQRYTKRCDWPYIYTCGGVKGDLQLIGNGDIFSFTEWEERLQNSKGTLTTCMIGRAALIKPWIFTEIKERRHWDISATERLEMLKLFCSRGLEHWGSDERGVETTRRFLLEWLSFLHRYVPIDLLEVLPQRIHTRPLAAFGRNDLETLFMSQSAQDWVKISERLLGPTAEDFTFRPKHKSNAYAADVTVDV